MEPYTYLTLKKLEQKSKAYKFYRNTLQVNGRSVNSPYRKEHQAFGRQFVNFVFYNSIFLTIFFPSSLIFKCAVPLVRMEIQ